MNIPLFAVLAIALMILYFIARKTAFRFLFRDYVDVLNELSRHFPGKVSYFHKLFNDFPSFVGDFSGHKFSLTFLYSTRIVLECHSPSKSKLKIFMYRKNPGPVLFAKRIQIEENCLDQFLIYSNLPTEARRYFYDTSRKAIIEQILQSGWEPPTITGHKISLTAEITKPQLTPDFIRKALEKMIALRK